MSSAAEIDCARAFDLAEYGGDDDYVAAVLVHPTGSEHLYLVSHSEMDKERQKMNWCPPGHERVGPLNQYWWQRVWDTSPRCHRRTRNGQLCRNYVHERGDACRLHRDKP